MDFQIEISKAIVILASLGFGFSASGQTEIEVNTAAFEGSTFITESTRLLGPDLDKDVEYEAHSDYGVVEGDIYIPLPSVITPVPDAALFDGDRGVVIDGYRWPDGKVYYRFSGVEQSVKNTVRDAVAYMEARNNVDFIEINTVSNYHILITDDIPSDNTGRAGCFSYVGYRGNSSGFQRLNLQRFDPATGTCNIRGIAIHELMHALGVWHEQSREDRNNYVTIQYQNITPGRERNFYQYISAVTDVGSYDYSSIMHYGAYAFTKNGQRTILTVPSGISIGQRSSMSNGDVAAIEYLYPSPSPPPPFNPASIIPAYLLLLLD